MEINKLLRPHLLNISPYVSARDEYEGTAKIFLDANENAYGSTSDDRHRRYPDPYQKALKQKISSFKGISPSQIFLGHGSDEPIDLLIRAFCNPGKDRVIVTPPTFDMYSVSARINDVGVIRVPLRPNDFSLDLNAMCEAIEPGVKIVFLCSPNNPTGNNLNRDDIMEIVKKIQGLVVVDEAYIDFSSQQSLLDELPNHWNLVILQTFSKAWGMAALRLGMAFASAEIIEVFNQIKTPYNISEITQELALRALDNHKKMGYFVNEIIRQREWLRKALLELPTVKKVYPSDANFLLVKIDGAHEVYKKLIEKGIIVRDRSQVPMCEDCLRITIGNHEENNYLLECLREICGN